MGYNGGSTCAPVHSISTLATGRPHEPAGSPGTLSPCAALIEPSRYSDVGETEGHAQHDSLQAVWGIVGLHEQPCPPFPEKLGTEELPTYSKA